MRAGEAAARLRALLISSTFDCFLSSVFSAFSFFVSYMRVPAACTMHVSRQEAGGGRAAHLL